MSLRTIPLEIFLIIVSQMKEIDKQCLRLTCTAFQNLIQKAPPATIVPYQPAVYRKPYSWQGAERHQRREFLQRLCQSGNLFSDPDGCFNVCTYCLKVWNEENLSQMDHLNGERECNDCSSKVLQVILEDYMEERPRPLHLNYDWAEMDKEQPES